MAKITAKQKAARQRNAAVARAARKKHHKQFGKTYKLVRRLGLSKEAAIIEASDKVVAMGGSKKRYGVKSKLRSRAFRRESKRADDVRRYLSGY